jgi:hypothetical protein
MGNKSGVDKSVTFPMFDAEGPRPYSTPASAVRAEPALASPAVHRPLRRTVAVGSTIDETTTLLFCPPFR